MTDVAPICAGCYGQMMLVTVGHPNGRRVTHKVCPTCFTGRSIDDTELVSERPRLTVVR